MRIDDRLEIPDDELSFAASRSGGPGGQNVNKVETRMTLLWDLDGSPSLAALGDEERERLRQRLATRLTKAGVLRVTSQRHRTQAANREAALERFAELLREALRPEVPRKPTRVPRAAKRRRLEQKRRHSERKRQRAGLGVD